MSRGQSSVPAYTRLAEQLKHRIAHGEFKPGERIPAEQEIIAESGLSRVTVRAAMSVLARDGWVVRKQGIGTFAGHPIDQELSSLRTTPEVLQMLGMIPDVKVLSFQKTLPSQEVSRALRLREGERAILMKRLYRSGGTPVALVYVYLPLALEEHAEVLRDERAPTETTYTILESKLGVEIKEAHHVVRARHASREVARALRVKEGDPVLVVDRLTLASDGQPLEFDVCHYNAERYTFSVSVPRRKLTSTATFQSNRRQPALKIVNA
jgi:GntR family transcriptional regulator